MAFTRQHKQELAEIKALTHELDRRAEEALTQLERITGVRSERSSQDRRAAQDRLLASPVGDGNGAGPPIAFVHIPKTAGGTVKSMFIGAYSSDGVHDAGNYFRDRAKATAKLSMGKWKGRRVSIGHVPVGLFRAHMPADTRYVTFLRDPVDRVLSHYHAHIHRQDPRRAGSKKELAGERVKAGSIGEALEMELPQLVNLATRFLCQDPSTPGNLPASALDEAKASLREFAVVGIQERFEESLALLQRTLGLRPTPYEDWHVSSNRPAVDEIPQEQRALIMEYNQLDVELYAFAVELFQDALAAAGEGLADDVKELSAV